MTYALNEIEAMGKRAARGVGCDWGIAEEAAKAVRWLAMHGLPGPGLLAELLTLNDGRGYAELAPLSDEGVWEAASGSLCPLVAGAALSDRAEEVASGREFELGVTAYPLLLAPYVAAAANSTGRALELSWPGVAMAFDGAGVSITGETAELTTRSAETVRCRCTATQVPEAADTARRCDVDADTWSRLNSFAQRTFAPATEASRLAGAGAGLSDND